MKKVILLVTLVVLTITPSAIAADVYINGGTCIFDDAMFEYDRVYLGIEGPDEPPVPYAANYSTGSPVHAELVDGGRIGWLSAFNFSTIEMTGGEIMHQLVLDNSSAIISGGTVGDMLEVLQCGRIMLYGTDFEVTDLNGVTTALLPWDKLSDYGTLVSEPGQTPYYMGTITGTLSYGTVLNNPFKIEVCQDSYQLFGDIYIRRFMAFGPLVVALSKQEETGLLMKQDSTLDVFTEGNPLAAEVIVVNSHGKDALRIQGDANISADGLNVAGGMTVKGGLNCPEGMGISENMGDVGIVEDFLVEIEEPDYSGLSDSCPVNPNTGKASPVVIAEGEWVLHPGYYSAGIIVKDGVAIFEQGIYTLGSESNSTSGLILKGTAVVDANEVMFHIVGEGQVSIGNDAILTASAPTEGDYKGFQFFQSRDNTTPAVFKGLVDCAGTWYFPANHVKVAGNARCSMLMADTIELSSNAKLTVGPSR